MQIQVQNITSCELQNWGQKISVTLTVLCLVRKITVTQTATAEKYLSTLNFQEQKAMSGSSPEHRKNSSWSGEDWGGGGFRFESP